jgi:hypothetical protein
MVLNYYYFLYKGTAEQASPYIILFAKGCKYWATKT